jgi:hypothetical protein
MTIIYDHQKLFKYIWTGLKKIGCQKPTKYEEFMFYEAVKNDLANSEETSFNNTISTTLSLITVLFEDIFEAVNIQAEKCGKRRTQNHPSHHWIKPIHEMDMTLTLISSTMMTPMHSKRIIDVVWGFLHLWFSGILLKLLFYFDGSKQDHVWK